MRTVLETTATGANATMKVDKKVSGFCSSIVAFARHFVVFARHFVVFARHFVAFARHQF